MRCLILVPVLFLTGSSTFCQQPDTSGARLLFTARHFGVDDGLPHRSITSLAQDHRGFIWAATPQGLARFDGYGFRNHTMADGLSSDAVRAVACDNEGQLWILNSNGVVNIMDPRSGHVATFQDRFAGRTPPEAIGAVTSMSSSDDGDILLVQNGHLVRYGGAQAGFDVAKIDCAGPLEIKAITKGGNVWCACRITPGEQWPLDLVLMEFPSRGKAGTPHEVLRLKDRYADASSMGQDLSGWRSAHDPGSYLALWADTCWRSGWVSADGGTIKHFGGKRPCWEENEARGNFRVPLTEDIWLVNTKVRRMHAGDDPIEAPVLFDLVKEFPAASFIEQDVLRDRAGNLWVAGEFGLFKISMYADHFQRFMQDTVRSGDRGFHIRGMVVSGGRLHVNTEIQGYWVLDAMTGTVLETEREGTEAAVREVIVSDGREGLWRGVRSELRHEDASGKVDRMISAPRGSYASWSLLVRRDGSLLIGCEKGLRGTVAGVDVSSVVTTDCAELDDAWVWHLDRDRDGQVLACTNAGLFRLKEDGTVLDRWWSGASRTSDPEHWLPADDIRYVHEDSAGVRWLATATQGLLRWDLASGELRIIGQREGLPVASIHTIFPDDWGELWMPTDNGLVRYDPVTGRVKIFTTADGIALNEFNRLAYAKGPDGRFYFGGLNGISVFDPADLRVPSNKPRSPLVIESVFVQHDGTGGMEDVLLRALDGGAILMEPRDRFLMVDFALLSYEDPALIRYAWRIDDIDLDWNEQHEPHLRITALPYGDHVLHIKAQDAEGRWSEELRIPITMLRPIYLRWWFVLLSGSLLAFLIYAAVRYRVRQLRQVILMRDRIASDLHDEVGSNLSSIVLFSTAVGKHADMLPTGAKDMLQRIKDNSKRAMESMNDIVWSVNSGHDLMGDLLDRMRAFAEPLCEAAGIELMFEADAALLTQKLDMVQRKNLYLIFKEAVNNALRHAQCSRIDIRLRRTGGLLELTVADNGIGFTENSVHKETLGGNGLGNMDRRAREIGGSLDVSAGRDGGTQVVFRVAVHG